MISRGVAEWGEIMKKTILALATTSLLLSSCGDYFDKHTPLTYCYYDVASNYEEYYKNPDTMIFSYKEVVAKEREREMEKKGEYEYWYEISVYLDHSVEVWVGGIWFKNYHSNDLYSPSECLGVDMDFIYSIEVVF